MRPRVQFLGLLIASSLAGSAFAAEKTASVGDIMLRIDRKECLPNAFGGCDIFGRKRLRGYTDIRFMGLTKDGLAVFRRRDAEIMNNETTMSRSRLSSTFATVQPSGNGLAAAGVTIGPGQATVEALPPDTVEFALDLRQSRTITVGEQAIDIISATPSQVQFSVR